MTIEIVNKYADGATEAQIAEVEQLIGTRLPDDYRAFLAAKNGGAPRCEESEYVSFRIHWSGQPWAHDAEQGILAFLYTLAAVPSLSWRGVYDGYTKYERRIPADTIPIGGDPGANEILLGVTGTNRGKVFFWYMDAQDPRVADGMPPTYDNVGLIASSFAGFLDSLYPYSEDDE